MEDLGLEDENLSSGPPRILRKPGLQAGLLKECQTVPAVFDRDLWQQQAFAVAPGDDEPAFPHHDLVGIFDLPRGREHRDLHFK